MAGRAIRFLRAADGVRPSALVAAAAKQDGGNGDAERRNARKATHWACSVRSPLVGINVVVAPGSVRRRNGASAQPSPIPPYLPDNWGKIVSGTRPSRVFVGRSGAGATHYLPLKRPKRGKFHADARPRFHLGATVAGPAVPDSQPDCYRDRPRSVHRGNGDAREHFHRPYLQRAEGGDPRAVRTGGADL